MSGFQLERATNVCLIITCVLVSALAIQRLRSAPASGVAPPPQYAQGEVIPTLSGIQFSAKSQTVLLALSSHCPFCAESMPFYARLAAARAASNFQLVVVGVEPTSVLTEYLQQYKLEPDAILSVQPGALKVAGTPTIVVVDNQGRVLATWRGALRGREDEVERVLSI